MENIDKLLNIHQIVNNFPAKILRHTVIIHHLANYYKTFRYKTA